ncbi:IclR family transcriptional regulator [Amycolatopsis sp. QT-25]|uniref:IclR family transcriptional regulator n=1 Tax=Amycolatopsis sp. QT-25 TaxID=3034022 RepID=UPI0023EBAFF9|nr:IclR family transcriptional regulator [Amycolatopsis sp. QT-25]WET76250.1 IclR family transcriptional regulator [Amycolatopsis sp. QT-25]
MPERIQSVERAATILRLLASGSRQLGVVELAHAMNLPKGTVHGLLQTLQYVGFVEQIGAGGKYRLGPTLLHLGNVYLDVNELRSRALSWADSLATRSGESVRIGTVHENKVLVIHHVFRPDDSLQVLEVGTLLPLHASALGKTLLGFDLRGNILADSIDLPGKTPATVIRRDELLQQINLIRAEGWAMDRDELVHGEASIAAPIHDERNLTVGAIAITGAIERVCDEDRQPRRDLVAAVRETARSISRSLGAPTW